MDSKVGQSEKNIDRALKLAADVSPCILYIDELEKALSGMGSSDKSDGGTTSRVIQTLLSWLADKQESVFVIGTANDMTKLSPELTRAGRFDEIFFFSLPAQEEREDILKIHLAKRGYSISEQQIELLKEGEHHFTSEQVSRLAANMVDFTGAEIEQVVSEAGRRAYAAFRKELRSSHHILESDIAEQSVNIVPLSKRNPSLLTDLRDWARHSAKCASSAEHKKIHGGSSLSPNQPAKLMEVDLDFPDIEA
jgi:SpoVK/Ycf46/Vps4 family AAA+-type ATPase